MEKTLKIEATGTTWEITVEGDFSWNDLEKSLKKRISTFEKTYSRFLPNSFVNTLSSKAGEYLLPKDAQPLFNIYFELENLTNGAFSPLIGKTLVDSGYDADYSFKSKPPTVLPKLAESLQYKFPKLTVLNPVQLDFGAAGKGYLTDLLAQILTSHGVKNYLIDAGHDYLLNFPTSTKRIGLENPQNTIQVIGYVDIQQGSLCGSSGNRRVWSNYHHIINGKTLSSPKDILATWVIADTALVADALSTALFFEAPELYDTKYRYEYLILYSDFSIKKSRNFEGELFSVKTF